MRSTVSAIEEKMEAAIHSLRAWQEEMMACQELSGAHLGCKKLTSEDMEAEHCEVPKKHAAVETGRAPNKRHRGRNLAAEGQPAVQKWHGTREMSSGKIGPGKRWYEEP
jgi:hypothetical protein